MKRVGINLNFQQWQSPMLSILQLDGQQKMALQILQEVKELQ